jgi:hypothetical protein
VGVNRFSKVQHDPNPVTTKHDNGRLVPQDLLDQIFWAEVIRQLEDPTLDRSSSICTVVSQRRSPPIRPRNATKLATCAPDGFERRATSQGRQRHIRALHRHRMQRFVRTLQQHQSAVAPAVEQDLEQWSGGRTQQLAEDTQATDVWPNRI